MAKAGQSAAMKQRAAKAAAVTAAPRRDRRGRRGSRRAEEAVQPVQFFGEVRAEARKITWTSRKETWITSVMVLDHGRDRRALLLRGRLAVSAPASA
jgi:preprotein translocase subunit SecE